ncbi:hypothetical protein CDD83_2667 [Cordyceps sp. RAO-2017]|nr:hypothetical protein CDD83_2667 [Cordyceps sp. RAO-2017]
MSNVLSLAGWYILPGLATSWIQSIYYGITIRAGDPKPAPNSARYLAHRRAINIAVVALYLAYTIYEADYELRAKPSFYEDLGLPVSASERDVKSRFRRLAALHHPDKAGSAADAEDSAAHFMHLKLASDTLQDAARRFAYERFGPDVVEWQKAVTVRDFVSRGVLNGILPYYSVAAATVYLLGLFGLMNFGRFNRWLVLASLFVFELHTVTRPAFPAVVRLANAVAARTTARAPYLPFEAIRLARKLAITIYIGISQIGPLLAQQAPGQHRAARADDDRALQQGLDRLETIVGQLDTETGRTVAMEMAPFKGDPAAVKNLQGKMREWLVQNTIRADPLVRDALGASFRKRRIDAPSGAKGNR